MENRIAAKRSPKVRILVKLFISGFYSFPVDKINTTDKISAKPIKSIPIKDVPSQTAERVVAAIGSLVEKILAFDGPILLIALHRKDMRQRNHR